MHPPRGCNARGEGENSYLCIREVWRRIGYDKDFMWTFYGWNAWLGDWYRIYVPAGQEHRADFAWCCGNCFYDSSCRAMERNLAIGVGDCICSGNP